jgi:hypothetical protein
MTSNRDMAIGIVIFNPTKSKRIIMNCLYVINVFKLQGLPVFTLELVYEGREPEIHDAFHVSGNSYMFHKENLCRILETKIPKEYTKLAFIDSDILFNDPRWYSRASNLLDEFDVIQPFEYCVWLDLTYKQDLLERSTVLKVPNKQNYDWNFHTGFAWCFRRDWYNKIGFYDKSVTGSGDTLFSSLVKTLKITEPNLKSRTREKTLSEYFNNNKHIIIKSSYILDSKIYHLYHGSRINRQYTNRHKILSRVDNIDTIINKNKDGVYEWIDCNKYNPKLLEYFKGRNDDSL